MHRHTVFETGTVRLFMFVVTVGMVIIGGLTGCAQQTEEELADPAPTRLPIPASIPEDRPTWADVTTTPPPDPTLTPTVDPLDIARASTAWIQLAEWDRARPYNQHLFIWYSTSGDDNCQYGRWSNEEELWNSFAPQLRDELLSMMIEDNIQPSGVRYIGTDLESDANTAWIPWWTNAAAPDQNFLGGKGQMSQIQATYLTADGEHRIRKWPVLIGHPQTPNEGTAGYLREIGPVMDIASSDADFSNGWDSINQQFNDHHLEWINSRENILDPIDPPLPEEC